VARFGPVFFSTHYFYYRKCLYVELKDPCLSLSLIRPASENALYNSCGSIGSLFRLTPVAEYTAFPIAGATEQTGGSPRPFAPNALSGSGFSINSA
jgi:hypothetical protein